MKLTSSLLMCLVLVSCSTTQPKPKLTTSPDIYDICKTAKKEAKSCIQSKGVVLNKEVDVEVVKVRGEKKIKGYWCWRSPEWGGMWVCGLTDARGDGIVIEVACNPQTMQDVIPDTLKHEFGHYWVMCNFDDWTHDSKYKSCFLNWNEPNAKVKSLDIDRRVIVDYIEE